MPGIMALPCKTICTRHGFSLGLFGVALLAFVFPNLGRSGGTLHTEITADIAVFLIFLMQGLALSTKALTGGIAQWRLHVFVQMWVFLFSALVAMGIAYSGAMVWEDAGALWKGVLFIGILPTTISSAASFTSAARGDAGAAIFNTVLANFAGVFLTPLWVLFLFSAGGADMPPVGAIFGKLLLIIILPLVLGQILRPLWWERSLWRPVIQPHFRAASNVCILFIVFAAFCGSVYARSWEGVPLLTLLICGIAVVLFLCLLSLLVWLSTGWARFAPPQRVAAFYCSAQKTLATGVPIATAIFAQGATVGGGLNLGLFLLPLLIWHPLQLVLAGILVPHFEAYVKRHEEGERVA